MPAPDAVIVGSGPNGLAAGVTLARAGLKVLVVEGRDTPGGGLRTEAMTLPGFAHDHCSSVHPLLAASPFFRSVGLADRLPLRWPAVAFAHPLDGGRAGWVGGSVDDTAGGLDLPDGRRYRRLMGPLVRHLDPVVGAALSDLRSPPPAPWITVPAGLAGLLPAATLGRLFATEEGRGLVAGAAAHSVLPLTAAPSGAYALLLAALAHGVGWPVVEGGSGRIANALVADLEAHGGRVETGRLVRSLSELPPATATLLDVTPRQLIDLAGPALPERRRRALRRFRPGPGVCKVDWALDGPVPWAAEPCRRAGTVHVGGTMAEVAAGEAEVAAGDHPDRPFCLVVQAGVADPTRAPEGKGTVWAYCHVPHASTVDMTDRIEAQIERFAPGFRDRVLARTTTLPADLERWNPTMAGGDIGGGGADLRQALARPTARLDPYRTGIPGVWLCSSSTPPGGGVHGMCGHHAARSVLRSLRISLPV